MTNRRNQIIAATAIAILPIGTESSSAQTGLLAIEFNEADQDGFDLWPGALRGAGSETSAEFATDASFTSGTTTTTLRTNTSFNVPANRGNLVDGTPEGFTYAGLYQDLLHAGSPTGFLTMEFSGLNPNQLYRFTLYAWDPGATDASDKEWTVTEGSADPSVLAVNFQDPLVDNESFALVFDVTTTATGTFTVVNTNGLPQSAVNGFRLESLEPPAGPPINVEASGADLVFTWDSLSGKLYTLRSETNLAGSAPVDWPVFAANMDVEATPPENTLSIPRPAEPFRFFVVEEFNAPPVTIFSENFDGADPGWGSGVDDVNGNTLWQLGAPAAVGPTAANSGSNCYGTNIAAAYGLSANIWLRTPVIDLGAAGGATLKFFQVIDMDVTELTFDKGRIAILDADSADAEIAVISADFNGVNAGWVQTSKKLPAAALGKNVRIEFRFTSDTINNFAGWYIDDVEVTIP